MFDKDDKAEIFHVSYCYLNMTYTLTAKICSWDNRLPFHRSLLLSLKAIESLADLSIVLPGMSQGCGLQKYKETETRLSGFQNLKSFSLHGLWVPNLSAIRRITPILRNSPNLESLTLSLDEDRLHFWEFREIEYDDDADPTGEWAAEDNDFEIRDFFAMLCLDFRSPPQLHSDGNAIRESHPEIFISEVEDGESTHMPRLSLKKLDLGISCILTKHIHLLTNSEVLEELAIANRPLST